MRARCRIWTLREPSTDAELREVARSTLFGTPPHAMRRHARVAWDAAGIHAHFHVDDAEVMSGDAIEFDIGGQFPLAGFFDGVSTDVGLTAIGLVVGGTSTTLGFPVTFPAVADMTYQGNQTVCVPMPCTSPPRGLVSFGQPLVAPARWAHRMVPGGYEFELFLPWVVLGRTTAPPVGTAIAADFALTARSERLTARDEPELLAELLRRDHAAVPGLGRRIGEEPRDHGGGNLRGCAAPLLGEAGAQLALLHQLGQHEARLDVEEAHAAALVLDREHAGQPHEGGLRRRIGEAPAALAGGRGRVRGARRRHQVHDRPALARQHPRQHALHQLELRHHVPAGVRRVVDRVGEQAVERLVEDAQADAKRGEDAASRRKRVFADSANRLLQSHHGMCRFSQKGGDPMSSETLEREVGFTREGTA